MIKAKFMVGRKAELPTPAKLSCGCGWVIYVHGSGGVVYDDWRYPLIWASAGYAVLIPDSFSNNKKGTFRYKTPIRVSRTVTTA